MECEFLKGCSFFYGLDSKIATALKEVYCHGNPMLCARRQVAGTGGHENIPPDLAPNHDHRIQGLLVNPLSAQ